MDTIAEESLKRFPEAEAPFSMNTFVTNSQGFRIQITIRDGTWEGGVAAFEDMIGFLVDQGYTPDAGRGGGGGGSGTAAGGGGKADETAPDWCPIHKEKMRTWTKEGRTWSSHKVGSEWCRGGKDSS